MPSYISVLESLQATISLIQPAATRTIILTGQSAAPSANLSPHQLDFLAALALEPIRSGFPYHPALLTPIYRPPNNIAASLRNTQQTLWTLTSPRFRRILSQTLQRALDQTHQRLYLITGSCGLQFANSIWPDLTLPASLDVHVISLGPVCLAPIRLQGTHFTAIQGSLDRWSRLLYRGPVHHRAHCGHLDYWSNTEVRQLVRQCVSHSSPHPSPGT